MKRFEIIQMSGHWEIRQYSQYTDGERCLIAVLACNTLEAAIDTMRRWIA